MQQELHISNLRINTSPQNIEFLSVQIEVLPGVQIATKNQQTGQIIVISEAKNLEDADLMIETIRSFQGVRNIIVRYHHVKNRGTPHQDKIA